METISNRPRSFNNAGPSKPPRKTASISAAGEPLWRLLVIVQNHLTMPAHPSRTADSAHAGHVQAERVANVPAARRDRLAGQPVPSYHERGGTGG